MRWDWKVSKKEQESKTRNQVSPQHFVVENCIKTEDPTLKYMVAYQRFIE